MRSDVEDTAVLDVALSEPHRLKKLILKLRWIGLYPDDDLKAVPPPWQREGVNEMRAENS
jgi:hypothetical protein